MTIIAKRYLNDTITDLPVVAGPATIALNAAGFGQLPGVINYGGVCYDCTQPGLISFFNTATGVCERRPMWCGAGKSGQEFIDAVVGWISACSWMHVHGSADENKVQGALANWMKLHKARLRCGAIADFMVWIMPQLGVAARRVGILTGQTPNGYDDGHICFEAHLGGKWRLFDMSNGCCFIDGQGEILGLKQVIEVGVLNCTRVKIDADKDHSADPAGNICFGIYWETLRHTPQGLEDWFGRIYQIPYVGSTAWVPAEHSARTAWVQSLGITVLPQPQWAAAFYP